MKKTGNVVVLPLTLLLMGCDGNEKVEKPVDPVRVKIMQVNSSEAEVVHRFSGTVEEAAGSSLSFAVMGTVKKIRVGLGDRVASGQLIAELDPLSMKSSYEAAKASLEQAEDAYSRMKELHEKGSLPEIQWIEVQSKLRQARSMEEIAQKNLKDTRLYAPFSGVIAEKNVEAGQNVAPGIPVVKLVSVSGLKVRISVPETEIGTIASGQEVEVMVPALNGKKFAGRIAEKGIVANALSRAYDVKIQLFETDKELMPGMVTEVRLDNQEAGVLCVIPAHIVQIDEQNRSFVWVNENGKAVKRVITCGDFIAKGVAVVAGLKQGDQIIVEGQQKVCNGTELSDISL